MDIYEYSRVSKLSIEALEYLSKIWDMSNPLVEKDLAKLEEIEDACKKDSGLLASFNDMFDEEDARWKLMDMFRFRILLGILHLHMLQNLLQRSF